LRPCVAVLSVCQFCLPVPKSNPAMSKPSVSKPVLLVFHERAWSSAQSAHHFQSKASALLQRAPGTPWERGTEMGILSMAAKKGPIVLFHMTNRTKCITLVSVMTVAGTSHPRNFMHAWPLAICLVVYRRLMRCGGLSWACVSLIRSPGCLRLQRPLGSSRGETRAPRGQSSSRGSASRQTASGSE
jgi:hypothetical protein